MGRLEPVDEVLEVHKFEPTPANSNGFNLTGSPAKVFPGFDEDVRDVLRAVYFVDQGGPVRTREPAVQRCMATSQAVHTGGCPHILELVPTTPT